MRSGVGTWVIWWISLTVLYLLYAGKLNGAEFGADQQHLRVSGPDRHQPAVCAGILLNRFGSVDENVLCGKAQFLWLTGVVFFAGVLALAGLPPPGTWQGKALIEHAATHSDYATWIVIGIALLGLYCRTLQ